MQKNKKRAYPAFIREDEGMQLVYAGFRDFYGRS